MSRAAMPIPDVRPADRPQVIARFMSQLTQTPECWVWNKVDSAGYGHFWLYGSGRPAHRVAYALFVGNPNTSHIRHRCDNTACVNPSHLEPGTHGDNMRDMKERFRGRSGRAKLTVLQVLAVRAWQGQGRSAADLGRQFGVSSDTILSVWKRQSYRWVDDNGNEKTVCLSAWLSCLIWITH